MSAISATQSQPDASPKTPPPEAFRPREESQSCDLEALRRHLAGVGLGVDPQDPPRQFKGGFANLNFFVWIDGAPAVLRSAPRGPLPPGAHDMAREHRVLSRLWRATALTPRSLHLCEDPSVLGAPFQLIEYRPGVAIRADDAAPLARVADLGAQTERVMVETLAEIHAIDAEGVGLGDFGRPEGFIARAVSGWAKRGTAAATGTADAALIAELSAWLSDREAAIAWENAPTLLHGDFKLDNMLLDEAALANGELRPSAILDWDMSTRGEPLFDLATMLSYWVEPGDPEGLKRLRQSPSLAPGMPSRDALITAYRRASGRSLAGFDVIRVLCVFKLAVVFLQLYARWRSGVLGDARYAEFDTIGEEALLFARDIAGGARL